ncbi:hypothetical protein ES703_38518 [subsurface metagenome]
MSTETETRATAEDRLHLELGNLAVEIGSKLDSERPTKEPHDHSRNNWCSELHHPCKKFLVHCRLDWRKRQQMDIDGRWRVEEGTDKEWVVKKWLGDIGFELTQAQRYFNTDDQGLERYKTLKISGRIDGMVDVRGRLPAPFDKFKELPVEIKSVSPHYWNSTKSIEDIKRHPKFWISKIPSQLNTYFVFKDWPGGLLILVTFGKKPRLIPMLFDRELWEEDSRRVRSVNAYVQKKKYPPPMPFDATVCGMCDFDHLCAPLKASTTLVEIGAIDEMELEIYLDLKEQNKQFTEMKAKLIGTKDKPGKYHGKDGLAGDIEIKTTRYPKKVFEVPDEEKQKYRIEDEEVVKTTIERIGK